MYAFEFIARLNIGVLEDSYINEIGDLLKGYNYTKQISTPGLAVFSKDISQVILEPKQLVLKFASGFSDQTLKGYFEIIEKTVCYIYEIQRISHCSIRFADIFSSENSNAVDTLNSFLNLDMKDDKFKKFDGVGFRFLSKHDKSFEEFKIEPFLKDMNILYVEGFFNCDVSQSKINVDLINNYYEVFKENINKFLNVD